MRNGGNGGKARAKWRASPVSDSVAHIATSPFLQLLPRESPTFVWSWFRVKHAVLDRFQPAVSVFANKNHIGGPLLSGGVFRNGSEGRVFYNTDLFTRAISELPADGTWFGVPRQVRVLIRLLSPDLGTAPATCRLGGSLPGACSRETRQCALRYDHRLHVYGTSAQ